MHWSSMAGAHTWLAPRTSRLPAWARFCFVLALAFAVIAARRPLQFANPDVWVEDATQVIPSYVQHGWLGLFVPTNGYLIIPTKVVSFVALSISFLHYAFVATVLATLVQAACIATIASAPTLLPARMACALAVVFLPTGTEVFALPLYTFWWTTLLLFVALLWSSSVRMLPRIAFLAVGAFSSPFVIAMVPAFIIRAAVERRRADLVTCGFAVVFAAVQAVVMTHEQTNSGSLVESLAHMNVLVSKYFGTALYSLSIHGAGLVGCAVLLVLIGGFFVVPREDRLAYGLLGLCLGAAIASSIARVPVTAPHPLLAGPRYFFYPTIATLWMLIWLTSRSSRLSAAVASALLGAYLPSLAADFAFAQQVSKEPWPEQVQACMAADSYTFDVQYGLPFVHWEMTLKGEDCRRLVSGALFQ